MTPRHEVAEWLGSQSQSDSPSLVRLIPDNVLFVYIICRIREIYGALRYHLKLYTWG